MSFNRCDYFLISSIMSSTTCQKYERKIATAFPNILQHATYMHQWNSKFSISLHCNCNYINFISLIYTEFYINVFRVYLIDTIVTHNAKQSNLLLFSLKQHNVFSAEYQQLVCFVYTIVMSVNKSNCTKDCLLFMKVYEKIEIYVDHLTIQEQNYL